MNKRLEWNEEKNELLKSQRNISFDQIKIAFESGGLIKSTKYPNQIKYPKQRIYIIKISNFVYIIPHVVDEEKIFLKTIIPNGKATKKYLKHSKT